MKRIIFTLIISAVAFNYGFAQKNATADKKKIIQEEAGRPDVPGDLFFETGFNMLMDDDVLNTKLWGSKIFNAYYQYGKNLGDSRFSVHPGIGIGTEKYALNDTMTIGYRRDANNDWIVQTLRIDSSITHLSGNVDVRKSKIATTYLDIPIELRWRSLKYDSKRSVKVAVGGKIGILLDSSTKVKYDGIDEKKTVKRKENFGLNNFRYGAYAKVGYGNFYLFYYHSLSTLFNGADGPGATEAYPIMFGVSLSVF